MHKEVDGYFWLGLGQEFSYLFRTNMKLPCRVIFNVAEDSQLADLLAAPGYAAEFGHTRGFIRQEAMVDLEAVE